MSSSVKNISYSSCELCGNPEAYLYPLFPKFYFEKNFSPHWFLCRNCHYKFTLIRRYIENSIFHWHKADYAQTNISVIIKEKDGESAQVYATVMNYTIEFNPCLIIKQGYGNGKINNIGLREDKCAICGSMDNLTVHHLFKRAVFGEINNNHTITLCASCHEKTEGKIHEMERMILEPITDIYFFIQDLLYLKKINFKDDKSFIIHISKGESEYSFILENKKNGIH